VRISKDLVAASATPLVLAILSEGESYGYAIVSRVRELSDGAMQWTDGLLYPLLHRLEDAGLVVSRWGEAGNGRRRRYYLITAAGQAALGEHRREWSAVVRTLSKALGELGAALAPGAGAALPKTGLA